MIIKVKSYFATPFFMEVRETVCLLLSPVMFGLDPDIHGSPERAALVRG
jgi:hypothetical protein